MPVKLKSGALLATVVTGSVFGLRAILSDGEQIAINKEEPKSDLPVNDLTGPHPTKETEILSTWQPEPATYSNESYQAIGIGNPYNGSPHPTKYRYSSSRNFHDYLLEPYSEEEKEQKRAEAEKVYGILNDYTFKFFMPCGFGTGWILDYQIPENENEYPTKWYIATNSHVIWRLRFSEKGNKEYGQKINYSNTDYLREKNKGTYDRFMKYDGEVRNRCHDGDTTGYFDFNISQAETGEARGADKGAIAKGQIREPKLFYSAFNFLDTQVAKDSNIPLNHFADFSVIELEFTSPDEARVATNSFATIYKNNKDAINVLGNPIEEKYKTKEDLWKAKDNYYIFGYAGMEGVNKWLPTANFNNNTAIASHLFGWIDKSKEEYKGFVDVRDSGGFYKEGGKTFDWNGEGYYEFGHRYKFRDNPLAPGSSGAMYVDGEGTAVGMIVRTTGNKHGDNGNIGSSSWAQPFRSNGKVVVNGVKTPAYDLISGVEGQKNSYKQQVVEYILNKGGKTWLSQKADWKPTKELL